ncbi:hypothetical protein HRI_001136100 [Hibiscus trionum]|uniref:Peptidase C14 caspase domain-containing protein n=1 Tax=Hibiscus trionum TaxID=183268 RepID=A0A9W7HCB6_HIBTR|nr:hypothetical protein HRI_001136100 [Hibiscus trionum]
MEMGRSKPCSRCRQSFMAKSRTQGECPSCRNNSFPIPTGEQTSMRQGLRSRIRTLSTEIRSKMHPTVVTPSLNFWPSASYSATVRSSKRAVLCGITYNNLKELRLKGSINDVKNMRELLITKFGRGIGPTVYTGHGSRLRDYNDDEVDGFDETICPVDFKEVGMIVDNDLNSLIVRTLTHGVTLHAIVDACHSGTILDLTKVYNSLQRRWEDNSPPSGVYKGTNGGLAICISACVDNQDAADTYAFTAGAKNGALTYVLVEILKKLPGPTYGDLFDLIHETFDNVNQSRSRSVSGILRTLFDNNLHLSQTPILSSSAEFDVYRKHFSL